MKSIWYYPTRSSAIDALGVEGVVRALTDSSETESAAMQGDLEVSMEPLMLDAGSARRRQSADRGAGATGAA